MLYQARYVGQSLQEYVLIGALVLLGVMSALVLVGDGLKDSFQGMVPRPTKAQMAAVRKSTPKQWTPAAIETSLPDMSISMKEVLTQPLTATVQTAGVNGVTRALSNSLSVMADKAVKDGEITPEQHALFVKLANQGHYLAEIESLIEKAAKKHQRGDDFFDTRVVLAGEKMTVHDLWLQIGFKVYNRDEPDLLNPERRPYSEANAFVELYHELKRSGALADPELNRLVTSVADKILQLNHSMDVGLYSAYNENASDLSIIHEKAAAELTNRGAAVVCSAGNASDTGTYCSAANSG